MNKRKQSAGDSYDSMSHNSIMHPRAMHYQQQLHHYQPSYPHAYNNDPDNWYLKQAQRDKVRVFPSRVNPNIYCVKSLYNERFNIH